MDRTKKNFCYLILILSFLIFKNQLHAQDPGDSTVVWKVEMNDGNVFIGQIVSRSLKEIFLKTEYLGTIVLQKKDIDFKEMLNKERMVDGEIWRENSIYGKYMVAPSGMLQEKGKGYYENKYVFINHINAAFSNNASIGVGLVPAFLFEGASTPVWITPQFRIKTKIKNLHISTGAFLATFLFDEYNGNTGIANIAVTYGNRDVSFTAGTGYGLHNDEWMRAPAFSFSGMIRLSRRTIVFAENILIPVEDYRDTEDQFYIFSLGARTMWRKISLDFGLLSIKDTAELLFYNENDFGIIPYLGIVVPFR